MRERYAHITPTSSTFNMMKLLVCVLLVAMAAQQAESWGWRAPRIPTPRIPTPRIPIPRIPIPRIPTPRIPIPRIPTPRIPIPRIPIPRIPSPRFPWGKKRGVANVAEEKNR